MKSNSYTAALFTLILFVFSFTAIRVRAQNTPVNSAQKSQVLI